MHHSDALSSHCPAPRSLQRAPDTLRYGHLQQVGGTLHGFWYGFGQYDGYAIYEAPDNVSMAGVVLAISSGGALASVETTVLMSVEETLEALGKGKAIGYRRPGE